MANELRIIDAEMKAHRQCAKRTPENEVKTACRHYLDTFDDIFYFNISQPLKHVNIRGISDMIVIHHGVVYFVETKAPKKGQSDEQKIFQEKLEKAGGRYLLIHSVRELANYIF
jgi:hypothetical protein